MSAKPVFRDLPRSLAERTYPDLRQWRGPTAGGHFIPAENPDSSPPTSATSFAPHAEPLSPARLYIRSIL